jgi:hypothetical protein
LQPGKNMMLWSDPGRWPNIAAGTGTYEDAYSTRINMQDASTSLTIGTTNTSDAAATLTILPDFLYCFQEFGGDIDRQELRLNPNSICNYFGVPGGTILITSTPINFIGGGNLVLQGGSSTLNITHDGAGYPTLSHPATLNIEPNAVLSMPGAISGYTNYPSLFTATNGDVECVYPSSDVTLPVGKIVVNGRLDLETSIVSCYPSSLEVSPAFFTITGPLDPGHTRLLHNSLIEDGSGGSAWLYINDPLFKVEIDGGKFDYVGINEYSRLHTMDSPIPTRPVYIDYSTFDHIPSQAIHMWRDVSSIDLTVDYYFSIANNDFQHFLNPGSDGILMEDFIAPVPDLDSYAPILAIGINTFTTATTFATINDTTLHATSAIHLKNTNSVVNYNTIDAYYTASGNIHTTYGNGIISDQTASAPATRIMNSNLCQNTIEYVGYNPVTTGSVITEIGAGIYSIYYFGYEEKNEIGYSSIGSLLGHDDDNTKIVFASYHDNKGPGIDNISAINTQNIEMRGIIHPTDPSIDVGGYSVIQNNNLDHNTSSGEVVVAYDPSNSVTFNVGNAIGTGSSTVTFGENSFIDNGGTDKLFYSAGTGNSIGDGTFGSPDHALADNYYQVNGILYTPAKFSPDAEFTNMGYYSWSSTETPSLLTSMPTPPTVDCLGGGYTAKEHGNLPQSMGEYDTNECNHLRNLANELEGPGTYQESYDTIRAYLTLCYNQRGSQGTFALADGDNDYRNNDPNRYVEYREWLKSVLYLRTDSVWYCDDVASIVNTFVYFEGHGGYPNGIIGVLDYILGNQRCDSSWFPSIQQEIYSRNVIWQDTVKDSLTEARPDTTIPSIDDIGLAILRGPLQVVHPSPMGGSVEGEELANLHVTENPFDNSTQVAFTLNDYGLVVFQLYDDLGKLQTSNGIGQVLYPGEHTFDIDGTKLASGVYYARISYHNGGVKTVMVRKR